MLNKKKNLLTLCINNVKNQETLKEDTEKNKLKERKKKEKRKTETNIFPIHIMTPLLLWFKKGSYL